MAVREGDRPAGAMPGSRYQRARRFIPWLALGVAGAWAAGAAWAALKLRGAPP